MPTPIRIKIGDVQLTGSLNRSDTAIAILEALPLRFAGSYWGDELFGRIPVECDLESDAVEVIEKPGTLGYWPAGSAFCVFWGPTPASHGSEIRAASEVNIVGHVTSGLDKLIAAKPDPADIRIDEIDD